MTRSEYLAELSATIAEARDSLGPQDAIVGLTLALGEEIILVSADIPALISRNTAMVRVMVDTAVDALIND